MRILALWLFALAALCSPAARGSELKFDEVILVEGKGRQISLLYVVLTEPQADLGKLKVLVEKYAAAALKEAAGRMFKGTTKGDDKPKYEGNVVFFVRSEKGGRQGASTGFGVDQLKEIAAAQPGEGRKLVLSAWAIGGLLPK